MSSAWEKNRNDPLFRKCVLKAAADKEFVQQFDRLHGSNLQRKGHVLSKMVDDATGKTDEDIRTFLELVHQTIYLPLKEAMR